jgi:ribonuclease VapC
MYVYLVLMPITMAPMPPETARDRARRLRPLQQGRHPAQLSFGDCFAYACARHLGHPPRSKGADFPQTDIGPA